MSFCTNCGHPLSAEAKFCENCGQPVKQISNVQPGSQINLPSEATTTNTLKQTSKPQGSSKVILAVAAGLFILLMIAAAYFLFFKPNPEKKAKKIADMVCNCHKDSTKFSIQSLRQFEDSFEVKQFKSKFIATNFLNSLYSDTKDRFDSCYNAAMNKYVQEGKSFSGKQYKKFETIFNERKTACGGVTDPEFTMLQNGVLQKINKLAGDEPTVEKIKNDLLGKKMIGWNFDYIDEFQQCEISNKARFDKRIEYDLSMVLQDLTVKSLHNASATVIYDLKDGEWVFNSVVPISITYTYHIKNDVWQFVNLIPGTRYTIAGNKFWVQDGDGGKIYKAGGNDGDNFTLTSLKIYLQSRETEPVDLVFTFYPKEN